MLPASGTVLVKKTDGEDWFEEVLDSSDIPVYAASGTNFQDANISGSNIEETLSKTADALNLKSSLAELTSTSGDLQSQIDSNDVDIFNLQSDLSTASGSLQSQIDGNDSDILDLQSDLTSASGSLQSQISSNDSDITNLQSDLATASGSLQSQIDSNDSDISSLQSNLSSASGTLQSQITSNDSDISQLQVDLTTASGYLIGEINELREVVQVPVTSGTDLLVTTNQLPLTSGSAFQIGTNYTVGGNSITIADVGTYRVSWIVGALQAGSTAANRSRNLETTLNINNGTFPDNARTTCSTDFGQGRRAGTMSGSYIVQTTSSNETISLRGRDLSSNSTAGVTCTTRGGHLKIERIE